MACTAGTFLADELLGAVGNLASVLGLVSTLPLVAEVLLYIKIDGMVIRFDFSSRTTFFPDSDPSIL